MRTDCIDHILANPCRTQQFRRLLAVFLRIKFEVDIVKQSGNAPELFFLRIPKFLRIPAHYAFHRQRMLKMEWLFIVLLQQFPSLFSRDTALLHCLVLSLAVCILRILPALFSLPGLNVILTLFVLPGLTITPTLFSLPGLTIIPTLFMIRGLILLLFSAKRFHCRDFKSV